MRRALIVLGIAVLCLPMLLVGFLLLAVKWPRMDGMTRAMGDGVSSNVASSVMAAKPWDETQIRRVIGLDANNGDAWSHLCVLQNNRKAPETEVTCTKAVGFSRANRTFVSGGRSFTTLGLSNQSAYKALADAQLRNGDPCGAENSYQAATHDVKKDGYVYVEGMGRAGVRCHDFYGARSALELATEEEERELTAGDLEDDEVTETKQDLQKDEEYLAITLNQVKAAEESKAMCLKAHPELATCTCTIEGNSEPICGGQKK